MLNLTSTSATASTKPRFDRPQPSIELPASAEPQVPLSAHPVVAIKREDTAFESKMCYTEAQQERARQAVAMHEAMGHPSDSALIEMLKSPYSSIAPSPSEMSATLERSTVPAAFV